MKAWEVVRPGPLATGPIELVDKAPPEPGPQEIRVRVSTCGVCRTDLHIVEGDLPPRRPRVVPGHEVVGTVDAAGEKARRFAPGARVGIAWLRLTCRVCEHCRRGAENLCLDSAFTGYDADGGYAEYAVVDESYAYALPDGFDDERAAPLLCAGIIGYRALKRAELPPGGRLGVYGFGGSAHLATQVAVAEGAKVHVVTRSERARRLALDLGAASAVTPPEAPPEPLDSAILFAPSGRVVPAALAALDRGGTLAIAGIHLSEIPPLDYRAHLFFERKIVSVTANTRRDGEEFLDIAARIGIEVSTVPFLLSEANEALSALRSGGVAGAAVLHARD
ncbi:MAG: zinc-dependent alcohol dehydrogenase family protein [Actinomycetota bacterium]